MTNNERIYRFNENRDMLSSFDPNSEFKNIMDELIEFYEAFMENDEIEMVDALNDIIVFSTGALWKMKFDPEITLDETLKEIESRKQDPIQAALWSQRGSLGAKWQKDKNQCEATKYKANYEKARI